VRPDSGKDLDPGGFKNREAAHQNVEAMQSVAVSTAKTSHYVNVKERGLSDYLTQAEV
jgi:hypothetical protein